MRLNIRDVVGSLEAIAPPQLAADWDNVGLLVGDADVPVRKLMLCIDLTGAVLDEALSAGAEMVMAYHPPIFKPVARLTADASPILWRSARAGLAVYSVHTAYDAAPGGANDVLADAIGIAERRPLEPAAGRSCRMVVFVPPQDVSAVAQAAFDAGAGRIGDYDRCAFYSPGTGTFRPGAAAHPALGAKGKQDFVDELRLELNVPCDKAAQVCAAIRAAHRYEEPVIDVHDVRHYPDGRGMGRIGSLRAPLSLNALIARIKRALGVGSVLVARPAAGPRPRTRPGGPRIETLACCAGSCGALAMAASRQGAQAYVTGEIRHHDALAAAQAGMAVICVGHSNSERISLAPLARRLKGALPGLDVRLSRADRDPLQTA